MKRLILAVLLLIPLLSHSQTSQSDRWVLLFENQKANEKFYVDTQTIDYKDYFEGHKKVYLLWIRHYQGFSDGIYHQQNDEHMVIDMDLKQYGLKSFISRKDGDTVASNQSDFIHWADINPESNTEMILNYCKKLRNSQ